MNSAESIQTGSPVANNLFHTDNEAKAIEKDCTLVKDKLLLEYSNIFQNKATLGQTDKIRPLKTLFYLLLPLLICSGIAIAISWVMIFPASIFLVAFTGLNLYLERNDPNYSRYHA